MEAVLEVQHLSVSAKSATGITPIIEDMSFVLGRGEVLVLLGESGSGKTILSRALTRLFPENVGMKINGRVSLNGEPVLALPIRRLTEIRRTDVRYIFQEPQHSLNPMSTILRQMKDASRGNSADPKFLTAALERVGIENPADVLRSFPHQLSAGQAQRVMIAMAVLPSPDLLIADEPTSSVDVSLSHLLLDLLSALQVERRLSMLLITHDLGVAREYGDIIVVMHKGRVFETSPGVEFFAGPLHPYSQLLMHATPGATERPGAHTELSQGRSERNEILEGCRFASRCPRVQARCLSLEPPLEKATESHEVRCFYWR